jgi:hypothetical protein
MAVRPPVFLPVLALAIALAAGANAQTQGNDMPPMVRVVVPVVGSTDGVNGVRWHTDVELQNDSASETTVMLELPAAPDQPFLVTTIPPRQTIRYADIVNQAFGLDWAISPLVVATEGRRSVTIRASAYATKGAEVYKAMPIVFSYGEQYYPQRMLQGLSFNDSFRTNVGLVNLGEKDASFVVALQRLPGRNVAVARFTIPPNTIWHTALPILFPVITKGDDFSLLIETSSPGTYVYANVIDNTTNEPKFVQPTIGNVYGAQ